MIFTIGFIGLVVGYITYLLAKPSALEAYVHLVSTGKHYGSWWIGAGRVLMGAGLLAIGCSLAELAWRWLP